MEDFYINITSQNESYDRTSLLTIMIPATSLPLSVNNDYGTELILFVAPCIVTGIGLPLTLVAIYGLYCQIRKDDVAPIYVINLLISDLIQLCCMIVWVTPPPDCKIYIDTINTINSIIYIYCLMVSVCFMVCVALERYLVIVHPLWYRFRRTIKSSVVVSLWVWALPLLYGIIFGFWVLNKNFLIIFGIFFFLPLPLFIFFLGGILKALSASRVPSDEKQRIIGILVLVLLIYTLLFLPTIILLLSKGDLHNVTLDTLSLIFVKLSPLADLTLYVFMRKGTIDKLLSSVCCCRMDSDDTNSPSV